jgi:hypothetical protein
MVVFLSGSALALVQLLQASLGQVLLHFGFYPIWMSVINSNQRRLLGSTELKTPGLEYGRIYLISNLNFYWI